MTKVEDLFEDIVDWFNDIIDQAKEAIEQTKEAIEQAKEELQNVLEELCEDGNESACLICATCDCVYFKRYDEDPFPADYSITNCAGLSARLANNWGNLRLGGTGRFGRINATFTVDGLRESARKSGKILEVGVDDKKPQPDWKCDILFCLWVLVPGKWGIALEDKHGTEIFRELPYDGEDFHIVSGRIDKDGNMPKSVYSTNGSRPLEGPAPVLSWKLNKLPATSGDLANRPYYRRSPALLGTPWSISEVPPNAIIDGSSGDNYYRYRTYDDSNKPQFFIIDDDFMRSYTGGS